MAFIEDISQFSFDYNKYCSEVELVLGKHKPNILLKMYPFEWLINEIGHDEMLAHDLEEIEMIEPAWKIVLGNKAILPLLWEMYPEHKNLLPAYFIDPKV